MLSIFKWYVFHVPFIVQTKYQPRRFLVIRSCHPATKTEVTHFGAPKRLGEKANSEERREKMSTSSTHFFLVSLVSRFNLLLSIILLFMLQLHYTLTCPYHPNAPTALYSAGEEDSEHRDSLEVGDLSGHIKEIRAFKIH